MQEVVGSSPTTPTTLPQLSQASLFRMGGVDSKGLDFI